MIDHMLLGENVTFLWNKVKLRNIKPYEAYGVGLKCYYHHVISQSLIIDAIQ